MSRQIRITLSIALWLTLGVAGQALAAVEGNEDTDGRLIDARVVEINDKHISVMARSGVEHVIGIDRMGTRVRRGKDYVSCAELRKDDIVTVEIDEAQQVKFAKQIEITRAASDQVARAPQ